MRAWKNLHGLHFQSCAITAKTLEAVESLPLISYFSTHGDEIEARSLARCSFLRKMEHIDLCYVPEIDVVLMALSGSKQLHSLNIDQSSPTEAAIKALSQCPNLKTFSWEQSEISRAQLTALSQLDRVEELWIRKSIFDPMQLAKLPGFRHLRRLYVNEKGWTARQIAAVKAALPQCQFTMDEQREMRLRSDEW